jgi:hypothetical protein
MQTGLFPYGITSQISDIRELLLLLHPPGWAARAEIHRAK